MRCSSSASRKTLLIVGGGVIGLEFATVYTRMGAKVLVVEMLPQILTGTDLEISKTLGRILKKQGVEIALGTSVKSLEKIGERRRSAVLNGEYTGGKDEAREFEMALVAVGRRPVTDVLNLRGRGPEDRRARVHRRRRAAPHLGTRTSTRSATSPAGRSSRTKR